MLVLNTLTANHRYRKNRQNLELVLYKSANFFIIFYKKSGIKMRQIATSIPVDSTIEYLTEREYIKENTDGTYSWNFNIQTGEYFSYKECLRDFMAHYNIPFKSQAYRSLRDALHEIDLDVKQPKSWNIIMNDRKHRSITTEFGHWFTQKYGPCSGREQRKLYCRLYMQWKAGHLNLAEL